MFLWKFIAICYTGGGFANKQEIVFITAGSHASRPANLVRRGTEQP